jgi:hypothetical protein
VRQEQIIVWETLRIASHSRTVTESRRMKLAEDLACMGKMKNTHNVEFLLKRLKVKKKFWLHEGLVKCNFINHAARYEPDFYAFEQGQELCFCSECEKYFEFINEQEISRIVELSESHKKNSAPLSNSPCNGMKLTS